MHARRRRRHASNPRRRRSSHRRHRRNPPSWAIAAIAATLGVASYAVASAGSFALTQRTDPSLNTLLRNRRIVSGLAILAGAFLAAKKPALAPYAIGVAAGGAVSLLGTEVTLALGKVIDKPAAAPAPAKVAGYVPMGAVYGNNMRGYVPMGAVYGNNMRGYVPQLGMGAVYGQDMRRHQGAAPGYVPAPPWSAGPFG